MHRTLRFIARHPLTRDRKVAGWSRFVRWQVESRLRRTVVVDWIEGARLELRRGMRGATGNLYCGLHEFADMAFVLHLLRPGDLFVDVGANVGSYTVLAGAVCGADVVAVEADPATAAALRRNVALNDLGGRVEVVEAALSSAPGTVRFSVGHDATNRVLGAGQGGREVRAETLDAIVAGRRPTLLKLDVEGHEAAVLAGAARTLADPALLAVETELDDAAVAATLAAAGFRRRAYDPFARRLTDDGGGANALYVRDEAAVVARIARAPRRWVLSHLI